MKSGKLCCNARVSKNELKNKYVPLIRKVDTHSKKLVKSVSWTQTLFLWHLGPRKATDQKGSYEETIGELLR